MLRKIPVAGCPISFKGLSSGFSFLFNRTSRPGLSDTIKKFLNTKHVFFSNSATSAFYFILEALKERKSEREVILPAYTASSLIIAIKKANLKPVLCDIALNDFNMDLNLVSGLVPKNTLCIVGVHMFGIAAGGLGKIKEKFPDIFIVEDCAQGFGSKITGKPVGDLGDISFFSFNRGKNLPTYGGGCIATNSDALGEKIKEIVSIEQPGTCGVGEEILAGLKIFALSLAVRPYIYGMLYPLLSCFKEKAPPGDFEASGYTDFQAGVALALLRKVEEFSRKRYYNGMSLIEGLKDIDGIVVPKISEDTEPAFNRLPIIIKDLVRKEKVEENLWKAGIETSRMYLKPLHHIFDLGYKKEDFPNAVYFAERLLTLPTHPLVDEKDIIKMIDIIREASA